MKLIIPEPCNKNWNLMTPQGDGRFCGSCEKVVVDFTVMNEEQIRKYFLNRNQRICGHFYTHQLGQQTESKTAQLLLAWYQKAQQEIKYKLPRMTAVFVLGLTLSLIGCSSTAGEPVGKVEVMGDSISVQEPSADDPLPGDSLAKNLSP